MHFFCTTRKKHICPYLIFDIFLYICNFFPHKSAWIMTKHILYLYLYLFLYFTSLNTSRRIVFARRSCWWEEVVKKITSQEGNFFTLFVNCYCITILKKMCWCWCTDAYRYTHADALMMIYDADAGDLWIFRVQGRVFPVSIFLLMLNDLFWLIDNSF